MVNSAVPTPLRVSEMERDILQAVRDLGSFEPLRGGFSPAYIRLHERYPEREEQRQLTVIIDSLVQQRLLYPRWHQESRIRNDADGYASGITAEGKRRLDQIRHPKWTWLKRNWFAVTIALITALAALAGVVLATIDLVVST